jgi:hypothetical protein
MPSISALALVFIAVTEGAQVRECVNAGRMAARESNLQRVLAYESHILELQVIVGEFVDTIESTW